uniref:Uncharacterized protein n=1 Tax=Xanthomonas phage MK21 TaxID=3148942 RepID=A0AAU8BTY5_9CAUD
MYYRVDIEFEDIHGPESLDEDTLEYYLAKYIRKYCGQAYPVEVVTLEKDEYCITYQLQVPWHRDTKDWLSPYAMQDVVAKVLRDAGEYPVALSVELLEFDEED